SSGHRKKGRSTGSDPLIFSVSNALPDAHPVFRGEVVFVAGLDVESLIPGVDVTDRADDAELGRAVRIGGDLLLQRVLAVFGLPDLGPAVEEALVAGDPVEDRCG